MARVYPTPTFGANEFDASTILLPDAVISESDAESVDLNGFLGFETDSLGLNFDVFSGDPISIDVESVKTNLLKHFQFSDGSLRRFLNGRFSVQL